MPLMQRLIAAPARLILRVEVDGPSMLPTLAPGERLLVHRTARVRLGDIIVIVDPTEPSRALVKRLTGFEGSELVVSGDNQGASRDSGDFGPVPRTLLVGRAWYRYFPASTRHRLRRGGNFS